MSTSIQQLAELAKKKSQEMAAKSGRDVKPVAKLKSGKNKVRILPSWKKELHSSVEQYIEISQTFGEHWIKNQAGEVIARYICVAATHDEHCDLCSAIGKAIANASSDAEMKLFESMKAAKYVYVNAIIRESDNDKPQILQLSTGTFDKVFKLFESYLYPDDEDETPVNIFDLDTGFDIIIDRQGTGLTTKYDVQLARKSSSVPASILNELNNLDEFVARQYEAGKAKALAAINSVAGNNVPLLKTVNKNRPALSYDENDDEGNFVKGSSTVIEADDEELDAIIAELDD